MPPTKEQQELAQKALAERRERINKSRRKYYENNKEKFKEYMKKYRENNKEKIQEYDKKYNKEKRKKINKETYCENYLETSSYNNTKMSSKISKPSILPEEPKPKKEVKVIRNEYQKQYRIKNNDKMTAYERSKYYKKKYNLDDEFTTKFGYYSGDVYKIMATAKELLNEAPLLKPHLIELLEKIDLKNEVSDNSNNNNI